MKITIERTVFEPTFRDGLTVSWEVAFTVETDTGLQLYAPTVVRRDTISVPVTEASVTLKAFQEIVPSQIYQIYKDVDVVDELDTIAAEILQEERETETMTNHLTELRRQREIAIEAARVRLEEARERRRAAQENLDNDNNTNNDV